MDKGNPTSSPSEPHHKKCTILLKSNEFLPCLLFLCSSPPPSPTSGDTFLLQPTDWCTHISEKLDYALVLTCIFTKTICTSRSSETQMMGLSCPETVNFNHLTTCCNPEVPDSSTHCGESLKSQTEPYHIN